MEENSILIAAGGTGGHISPGFSLFENLEKQKITVFILSSIRNKSNPDLLNAGDKVLWHNPPEFPNSLLSLPVFFVKLIKALIKIHRFYKEKRFKKVIAMGGYTSFPVLLYCRLRGLPYFLCEQNCVPGKITRLFRKKAAKLFISFPLLKYKEMFKPSKILETGNPVREKIIHKSPFFPIGFKQGNKLEKVLSEKMDKSSRQILFMGGSQGARQINLLLADYLSSLENLEEKDLSANSNNDDISYLRNLSAKDLFLLKKDQFTVITGELTYEESRKQLEKFSNVTLLSYSDNIQELMQAADIVVARSGAGLLAEAPLYALPMILIPYPYAADSHQIYNARYAEDKKAAFLLDGEDIKAEKIIEILHRFLDKNIYLEYSKNSFALARPGAAGKIVSEVLQIPSNER